MEGMEIGTGCNSSENGEIEKIACSSVHSYSAYRLVILSLTFVHYFHCLHTRLHETTITRPNLVRIPTLPDASDSQVHGMIVRYHHMATHPCIPRRGLAAQWI